MKFQLLLLLTSGSSFWGSVVEGQNEGSGAFPGVPYPPESGQRCVDKVIMEEKTVWDDVINCDHSYDTRCFTSMSTTYESVQEEECNDNYVKNCFLSYETKAMKETVKICRTPLVKDCNTDGEEICRTEYESECWTKQEEHEVEDDVVKCETIHEEKCEDEVSGYTTQEKCSKWPKEVCSVSKKATKKLTPITACTKEPTEICAPAGCGLVPGEETCHDKVQTVVHEVPVEECSLDPRRACKHVTKLLPKLEPVENCIDVPKEVCVRSQVNPQKKAYPVVKKWCYTYGETTPRPPKEPECRPFCKKNADDWKAGKLVTCEPSCRDDARKYPNECSCECPKPCQDASKRGQYKRECEPWHDDPKCKPPPPPPVCRQECRDIADDWRAGKYVTCEPSCRSEAIKFPNECSCECPKPCQEASRRRQYKKECEPWHQDPKCKPPPPPPTPPPTCPNKCKRKCVDGELESCPRGCEDWCDDPTCGTCTVTCPHKCSESNFCRTGGRLGTEQCSCSGVLECGGVPGCCPSKFSFLVPSFGQPIVYNKPEDAVDLRSG